MRDETRLKKKPLLLKTVLSLKYRPTTYVQVLDRLFFLLLEHNEFAQIT